MKDIVISPAVKIPLAEYATQGNAILGIRDSGKTFTATWFAEQLITAGIPIIVFDPIGIWRNLQIPAAVNGKGFDVVVAGDGADLPLEAHSAPQIVRAAMNENIPLVVDLFSARLSKADWKRIVRESVSLLLHENRNYGVRHVFIEEAAEFAPQRIMGDQAGVYSAIEQLARMGGNSSLGYTLISQRAEEINKAVLELCDMLVLHRQKGRHSITALGKWLDVASTTNRHEITDSLPVLKQGECWIWSQGSTLPQRVQIPKKKSMHPDRRNPLIQTGSKRPPGKTPVDVSTFVARLKLAIPPPPQATPPPTKSRPKRALAVSNILAGSMSWEPLTEHIKALESQNAALTKHVTGRKKRVAVVCKKLSGVLAGATALFSELREILEEAPPLFPAIPRTPSVPPKRRRATAASAAPRTQSDPGLGKAENSILSTLAQHHPKALNKRQLALMSGYSAKGGAFANALSSVRTKGYIAGRGTEDISLTDSGLAIAPTGSPLPKGAQLAEWWIQQLPKAEGILLAAMVTPPRRTFEKAELGALTNYEPSGGAFANAISKLRTLGLISKKGEPLQAAPELFGR